MDGPRTEFADAIVEGVGDRFVWVRVPDWHEHRILTVPRANLPRLKRHPRKGDSVRVGWVSSPHREKWGIALNIHWVRSSNSFEYPLEFTSWEVMR